MRVPLRKSDIGKPIWLTFWDHMEGAIAVQPVQALGFLESYSRLDIHIRSWGTPGATFDGQNYTDFAILRSAVVAYQFLDLAIIADGASCPKSNDCDKSATLLNK